MAKFDIITPDEKETIREKYRAERLAIDKINRSRPGSNPTNYPAALDRHKLLTEISDALGMMIRFLEAYPKNPRAKLFASDAFLSRPSGDEKSDKNWVNSFFIPASSWLMLG